MSKLMTSIRLEGTIPFAKYESHSRQEMIALYRLGAEIRKAEAERILEALDSDFIVEQYNGVQVRKNIKRIEP